MFQESRNFLKIVDKWRGNTTEYLLHYGGYIKKIVDVGLKFNSSGIEFFSRDSFWTPIKIYDNMVCVR